MKLLQDLLFTDYGLMSLIGIVFMLGMMVFFLRLFLRLLFLLSSFLCAQANLFDLGVDFLIVDRHCDVPEIASSGCRPPRNDGKRKIC